MSQNSPLPGVRDGNASIIVESYNPTGFSFYGTDLISNQSFAVGEWLDVAVRAKMDAPEAAGVVGGIFLYSLKPGSSTLHDEIDFELLGNQPGQVQTNVYADEPLGVGHPVFAPYASGSATDYHVYEMKWQPSQVSWYVDGQLVRVDTDHVPSGPMYLHLNMWVPAADWAAAYSATIQPVASANLNQAFSMSVDSVTVTAPDTIPPTTSISGIPSGWTNRDVSFSLSATDNALGSGMSGGFAKTEYRLDGAWTTGSTANVPAPADHAGDGTHLVSYRSSDAAGNLEDAKSAMIKIDTRAPTTSGAKVRAHKGKKAIFRIRVADPSPGGPTATVRIRIRNARGKVVKALLFTRVQTNAAASLPWARCTLSKGTYRYRVYAVDAAGNPQEKAGGNKLAVK